MMSKADGGLRYLDVEKRYYKETKNRIFENVLAADTYSTERPEESKTNKTNSEES